VLGLFLKHVLPGFVPKPGKSIGRDGPYPVVQSLSPRCY
jgi:hypothetical protein